MRTSNYIRKIGKYITCQNILYFKNIMLHLLCEIDFNGK